MPAGSGSAVRTTLALFLAGGVIATLTFSRIALSDTVFTYDAAGHLLSVRNSETDPEACGNPPKTCRGDPHGDPVCAGGDCRLQCDPGWTDAGGRCADTSSDPTACGANLDVCPAPAHGVATCVQGACLTACDAGYVASGTACVSLTSDPANCGSLGKRCSSVPGYLTCCAASVCGASDGAACVNVTTDPSNCGWIGHVCASVGGTQATCAKGRCSKPTGTPRVDRVNGVAPSGQAFRSPFWSGLTLTGANLDRVTWVELEDWGADTVDGTADGVQSIPTTRRVTLPTGSGGPTIHFQQTASTLTIDADSLEFQAAFDPRFETGHWLKVRVHYTSSGADRSILANVSVSLTDLVSQGLPAPSITGIATYAPALTRYDPATGLLSLPYDEPSSWPANPTSVMSPDLRREFPVLRVATEGLYLAKGLDPRQIGVQAWDGYLEALIVSAYDHASSAPLLVGGPPLIVRGTDLWDDGPLRFTDEAGNVVGPDLPVALFAGHKLVTSDPVSIERRTAFLEFASMRGVARTPWILRFAGTPAVDRIEWGSGSEGPGTGWPGWAIFDSALPLGQTLTITGVWLGDVDQMFFTGPARTWIPYQWGQEASEPAELVEALELDPAAAMQFRVVDDRQIQVWIAAHPATERVVRARVDRYCNCSNLCWSYELANDHRREFLLVDSRHGLTGGFAMNPAVGQVSVMANCGRPPNPVLDVTPIPVPRGPGPGDCTNSVCE